MPAETPHGDLLGQLAAAAAGYIARRFGDTRGRSTRLLLEYAASGDLLDVRLELVPVKGTAEVRPPAFVATPFQRAILKALAGKAMRTDDLAAKVGDRRRLFRDPGGLPELQEHDKVRHHPRLGFYRPDDPPAELQAGDDAA